MKKVVFALFCGLMLNACSHGGGSSSAGAPSPLDRRNQQKPGECPLNLEGTYNNDDVQNPDQVTIYKEGSTYVIDDPRAGKLPVNGTPTVAKDGHSTSSAICENGGLNLFSIDKQNQQDSAVLTQTPNGLKIVNTNITTHEEDVVTYTKTAGPAPQPARPSPPAATKCADGVVAQSYSFTQTLGSQTCTTGRQNFCGQMAYCAGLHDEELNNNCAQAERNLKFIAAGCL